MLDPASCVNDPFESEADVMWSNNEVCFTERADIDQWLLHVGSGPTAGLEIVDSGHCF